MPASGRVLHLDNIIEKDQLGCTISDFYIRWCTARQVKMEEWKELRKYIFATDTTTTTNSSLPWKNKTTVPKITQIRDNLIANYISSLFPKRRWLVWEGADKESETKEKADAITSYMSYVIDQPDFKDTVRALIQDYVDYGNCFAMSDWQDDRVEREDKIQTGYVGPIAARISPLDIVFNPVAPSVMKSPKIVRSIVSLGEVKEILERQSTNDGERETAEALFNYLNNFRHRITSHVGDISVQDEFLQVDGFESYRAYIESNYAEILTFYGDIYNPETKEFYKNYIIQVVDRHKIIRKEPNPSFFGNPGIYHAGWRLRQDNLWAMGPLDNLVGMQYRIDHIENLKADLFDLVAYPPLKIKGYVEDFEWGPFEKIITSEEGDVELMNVDSNPLNYNLEIAQLQALMEEMAGSPKEAMGFRTPGEKTAYEVQRLENAASRIFQAKITQFEEQILEPLLNDMLELAMRKVDRASIRVMDDEFKVATFINLSADDITGSGRIKPVAARHFAEKAERVQNLTAFSQSPWGQNPSVMNHVSGLKIAELFFNDLLDLEPYGLVTPNVALTEQAEAAQLAMQHEEDVMMAQQTPSGLTPDDTDEPFA
jgi:hypothetical protein